LEERIYEFIARINLNVLPLFIFYVILRSRVVYRYMVSRITFSQAAVIIAAALLETEMSCYYNPLNEPLLMSSTVIRNGLLTGLLFGRGTGWVSGLIGGLLALWQGTEPVVVKLAVIAVATCGGFLAERYKEHYGNIWTGRIRALCVALLLYVGELLVVDTATYFQLGSGAFAGELVFSVWKITGFIVLLFLAQRIIVERENINGYDALAGEMRLARQLQLDIVSHQLEKPFAGVRVAGALYPAKDVGGDWYDCFWLGKNRLCLVMADVSGKGVPAALFMVVGCMLFRAFRADIEVISPAKIMESVNNDLCADNGAKLFITAICAILDTKTGELVYCNVGHPKAYIKPATGPATGLPVTNKGLLGCFRNKTYCNNTVQLRAGDYFLLYTDGVTEAQNADKTLFGTQRLETLLAAAVVEQPADLCATIVDAVNSYSAGIEQSDDITVLVANYPADGDTI